MINMYKKRRANNTVLNLPSVYVRLLKEIPKSILLKWNRSTLQNSKYPPVVCSHLRLHYGCLSLGYNKRGRQTPHPIIGWAAVFPVMHGIAPYWVTNVHTRTQEHLNCSFVWMGASVAMATAVVSSLPLRKPNVTRGLSKTCLIRTNQWTNSFFRKHRSMCLPNELSPMSPPFWLALLIKGHHTKDYLLLYPVDSFIIRHLPQNKSTLLYSDWKHFFPHFWCLKWGLYNGGTHENTLGNPNMYTVNVVMQFNRVR